MGILFVIALAIAFALYFRHHPLNSYDRKRP